MKTFIATLALVLLSACQSQHRLEKDTRYIKLATVTDKYEFSEIERDQADSDSMRDSNADAKIGIGGFGGIMLGLGDHHDNGELQPQVSDGANRYIVQPVGSAERIEVLSCGQYKVGDCVKVLAGHPTEFPRLFALKADERCN